MDIKEKINQNKFEIPSTVAEQKDIRFSEYDSIFSVIEEESIFESIEPDDTVVVLALYGKMYELNLLGTLIWEGLKNKFTFEEILKKIISHFDIEEEKLHEDIFYFIEDLKDNNLILDSS